MKTKTVSHKDIVTAFRKEGNPDIAAHSRRFFKTGKGEYGEGDRFLGIRVPVTRKYARQYREASLAVVVRLLTSPYHEERLMAVILLAEKFRKGDPGERRAVYDLYMGHTQYINSWDIVDSSAHLIVGSYLQERSKNVLRRLARSDSLWERRIAIMATFHYIRRNEFAPALDISKLLVHDTEDLIHKAVGWMLREIGKRDMDLEERFLKKYIQGMPRTMLRYAIEKFPEQKRRAYLSQ